MSNASIRVGVGTRFVYDGEVVEVVEMLTTVAGSEVVLKNPAGTRVSRAPVRELLVSDRARVIPDGSDPAPDEPDEIASVILAGLTDVERKQVRDRAAHVREVLTGYRSGSVELAADDEPRGQFDPSLPLTSRYEAKAAELGRSLRTIKQWVADFRSHGEAGLAPKKPTDRGPTKTDDRWVSAALEVMVEHTEQSRPSRSMVIKRTNARVVARFGEGVVALPSRATAFRVLERLEKKHPTFRLSTKRNRDIADRPASVYGKLRPTRPGEYLLMDTTRLDVFAMDPITLRWVQAELTAAMDWYTRCITGLRITPVSTKSVDVSSVLYQCYRPRPAAPDWPKHAVWPEHGIPRSVLVDTAAVDTAEENRGDGAVSPAVVPETIMVDHGKVYVSDHVTSVCRRMSISIQPARLRTGRDKGPVERFFRSLREDLLQALPGYKGPDVHSRGLAPESEAFFFLDELEAIVREWIAVVYHHRPHGGLVEPHLPKLPLSPAMMFEHGIARAGYIEAPRDPDLAYEFLKTEWRTIQHYGVELNGLRYNGDALNPYRNLASDHTGQGIRGKWPIQVDPDDITRIYFRDPETRTWNTLWWEHAPALDMPLSDEALRFARQLAAEKYTYPDDKIAIADLLERWNLNLDRPVAERRLALRLSREQAAVDLPGQTDTAAVSTLPSVARVLQSTEPTSDEDTVEAPEPEMGDDDTDDELDDDFYADALEDV
ncbi:Mu transposase, C-terminal [Saccharopolyspora antimicrobica]|uniref:Mu transposase, C-terminal n=1 Tax=Saccharopolyspora antimicrobica TaxID=455193 RepID=A0A1I4XMG8_9PSEU|nr:Mu transposase C-terminal domain-containing protein [Saccharopolyspora antimicrobica]RKT84574.1 Mu transposase-like protein [Saccharopolyspora antimicrobica]SFN27025.1 Mu transposase, C-terminal [Saccharopolyspora antimicrobica]